MKLTRKERLERKREEQKQLKATKDQVLDIPTEIQNIKKKIDELQKLKPLRQVVEKVSYELGADDEVTTEKKLEKSYLDKDKEKVKQINRQIHDLEVKLKRLYEKQKAQKPTKQEKKVKHKTTLSMYMKE